jgi:hypothetical protein
MWSVHSATVQHISACSLDWWLDGWCWFVLREKYCCLIADDWFILREKYYSPVADKPNKRCEGQYTHTLAGEVNSESKRRSFRPGFTSPAPSSDQPTGRLRRFHGWGAADPRAHAHAQSHQDQLTVTDHDDDDRPASLAGGSASRSVGSRGGRVLGCSHACPALTDWLKRPATMSETEGIQITTPASDWNTVTLNLDRERFASPAKIHQSRGFDQRLGNFCEKPFGKFYRSGAHQNLVALA